MIVTVAESVFCFFSFFLEVAERPSLWFTLFFQGEGGGMQNVDLLSTVWQLKSCDLWRQTQEASDAAYNLQLEDKEVHKIYFKMQRKEKWLFNVVETNFIAGTRLPHKYTHSFHIFQYFNIWRQHAQFTVAWYCDGTICQFIPAPSTQMMHWLSVGPLEGILSPY